MLVQANKRGDDSMTDDIVCGLRALVALTVVPLIAGCVMLDQEMCAVSVPVWADSDCANGCFDLSGVPDRCAAPLEGPINAWLRSENAPRHETWRTWLTLGYVVQTSTDIRKREESRTERQFHFVMVCPSPQLDRSPPLPVTSAVHGHTVQTRVQALLPNLAYAVVPLDEHEYLRRDFLRLGVGEVVLEYGLTALGQPTAIEVVSNYSNEADVASYSRKLISGWRFQPEMTNGSPQLKRRYRVRICIESGNDWARQCRARPLRTPGHSLPVDPIRYPAQTLIPPDGVY